MNAKNVNEIIDALAARLAVPAAHVWGVLVRQAAVEFWTSLAVNVVLWIAFAIAYRILRRGERDFSEPGPFFLAFGIAALGIGALGTSIVTASNLGYLINPEYYALREILGALK